MARGFRKTYENLGAVGVFGAVVFTMKPGGQEGQAPQECAVSWAMRMVVGCIHIGILHDQRIIKVADVDVFWSLSLQWSWLFALFARFLMEESLVKSGLIRTWRKILPCNDWMQQGVRLSRWIKIHQPPSKFLVGPCFVKKRCNLVSWLSLAHEGIHISLTSH